MDLDKIRRRQSLKVLISEAIMVLSVVITVVVLAFIVSGYWVDSDFEVKRQGLLQIYSIPTGANVDIDGNSSWLQRTNTSKVLQSGEHTITLSKEGYDTWTKTINITEGLLYRIHYPRLFLNKRFVEKALILEDADTAIVSPDHEQMVVLNNTTNWQLLKLTDEKIVPKDLDISDVFSSTATNLETGDTFFTGEILQADWDFDGNKVLFKNKTTDGIEWVVLDLENIKNSVNLTKLFGANFTKVKIYDHGLNTLLAVQNNNLHRIDVSGRSISSVLVEDIIEFDYYNNEVVFSATSKDDDKESYYIGRIKIGGDNKITKLKSIDSRVMVAITKFYEDKYILVLEANKLKLYGDSEMDELSSFELSFNPDKLEVGHNGEFIIFYSGSNIATLDMEAKKVNEWQVEGERFGWIDNSMIYTVLNGKLVVYDFDGLNRRELSEDVSSQLPVAITDDRFLYYFSDDALVREWLIAR